MQVMQTCTIFQREAAMNESERLATELERALTGSPWHGASWRDTLNGVNWQAALQRPLSEAHHIAEIVLHTTTWLDVVRRRLEGGAPKVSAAQDWPAADVVASEPEWSATMARLFETGGSLAEAIRRFPAARL